MKRNKELDKFIPLCSYDEYGGVWTRDAIYKIMESHAAAMQARTEKMESENSVMYAAILEASELGNSAAMRCKVELQRIARNEAK